MLNGKKIVAVMPAYQAEKTLVQTYADIPLDFVDEVILVDDGSVDNTANLAKGLGLITLVHLKNHGYGRNQKTCYREALKCGADIVIMVHPDSQYSPKLIVSLAGMLAYGVYDVALGSRILGVGALQGGMPLHKYVANRLLTFVQNIFLDYKLSEYHTGYRAFSRQVLESLPLELNDDDFVFDNQMLAQIIFAGYRIGEISPDALFRRGLFHQLPPPCSTVRRPGYLFPVPPSSPSRSSAFSAKNPPAFPKTMAAGEVTR
jgi:glycosyltransferase involved in cell wall biosynthesis